MDLADKTEREFVKSTGAITGELSIGSGETLSMHTLSQWIASFRAENPMVQYDIFSATADEIKDRLEKGILDMGLLVEPVDIAKSEFENHDFVNIYCSPWGFNKVLQKPCK